MQKVKEKKCKACPAKFLQLNSLHVACSPKCALALAKKKSEKAFNKKQRADKLRIKSKSKWLQEAQAAFNKYIRLEGEASFHQQQMPVVCISCQKPHKGQFHAGHYRSVGSAPELRFEEDNCHLQCAPCNNHLSGNLINYRVNLINKIGIEKVEWLEGDHGPKKYTIEDIKNIKSHYTVLARELEKQLNDGAA